MQGNGGDKLEGSREAFVLYSSKVTKSLQFASLSWKGQVSHRVSQSVVKVTKGSGR
jgi:hypothetical protein